MTYDYDDFDSEDAYDVDCPHCGKVIYEDVDQCPHCRNYISNDDFKKPTPKWVIVLIIVTIASFLIPTLGVILRSMR